MVAPFASLTTIVPAGACAGPTVAEMVSTLPDIDAVIRPGVTEDCDDIAYGATPPVMPKPAVVPLGTDAVPDPPAAIAKGVAAVTVTTKIVEAPVESVIVTKVVPAAMPFTINVLALVVVTVAIPVFELTTENGVVPPVMVCANCVPAATDTAVAPATVIAPAPALTPQPNGVAPDKETETSVNDTPLLTRTNIDDAPPTPLDARVTVSRPFARSADRRLGSNEVAVRVSAVPEELSCTTKADAEAPQSTGPRLAGVTCGG